MTDFHLHARVVTRTAQLFRRALLPVTLYTLLALPGVVNCGHGQDPIATILKIERGGQGIAEAHAAAQTLQQSSLDVEALLTPAATANPVAKNWLLAIAGSMLDKQGAEKAKPALEKLLADPAADGALRYWALDRLAGSDPAARAQLLEGRIEDPSLDIRFEAIEQAFRKLPSIPAAQGDEALKKQAIAGFQQLLKASRQHVQINAIGDALKQLGAEVDLRKHYGFVTQWQVLGPFDNREGIGFPLAYKPEEDFARNPRIDINLTYQGKDEGTEISWQPASTDKPDGMVDLNPIFLNEKGAVAYAYASFESPADIRCQVRFGTPNANKLWINGQEVASHQVYHASSQIDQYVATVELNRGINAVLLKLCQNEQTEAWAQDFSFMLRFTDFTGAALN